MQVSLHLETDFEVILANNAAGIPYIGCCESRYIYFCSLLDSIHFCQIPFES